MLLSVIIPNYNHGAFLEKRLRSILAQLMEEAEIVIIDDASTDHSVEVIDHIASSDKRVRFFKNPHNLGVVKTANIALREARGKYVAPFGADDIILDGFIEKTMRVLLEHPEIAACCSDPGEFLADAPEDVYTRPLLENVKDVCIFNPEELIRMCRTQCFYLPGHTIILKRESLLRFGGYDESLGAVCDWFLHHSIALHEGVAYIPQTLALWRKHAMNYSKLNQKQQKEISQRLFALLQEKRNQKLRHLFKQSTLLRAFVCMRFPEILWQPREWDILCKSLKHLLRVISRKWIKGYFKKMDPSASQMRSQE